MSAEPSALSKLFGSTKGMEADDEPSDEDVKKAKSDAFDAFFDAMHGKDKEGARKAMKTMMGEDDDEEETADTEPPSSSREMG